MTQINPPVVSFSGGMIGKVLHARVDLPFYPKSSELMENFWPLVHGPMTRRPPLMYVDSFDDHNKKGFQLPFLYTTSQSYNLLVTDAGIAFYTQDGRIELPSVTAAIAGGTFGTDATNEALSATFTASTTASGAASNLNDGSSSTVWVSDATATQTLTADMGSAKTLYFYWLTATTSAPENAPAAWTLKGSATGAWAGEEVTLQTISNDPPWRAGERRRYNISAPGSYRYYRLTITAVAGAVATPPAPGGTSTSDVGSDGGGTTYIGGL